VIMKRMRLFPFLFALHPIVATYIQIDGTYPILSVAIVSLFLLGCTFMLYLALMRFFDRDRVAMALSAFWIWSFSYSSFRSIAGPYIPYGWGEKFLMPAWFVVFAVACLFILNKRGTSKTLNQYFTALAILLILFALWPPSRDTRGEFKPTPVLDLKTFRDEVKALPDSLPDIYYILADAYPSPSALKDVLDFDDSGFVGFLREKGFFVADRSHSNYPFTLLSLSSTLNMQYLPMKSQAGESFDLDCNVKSLSNSIRESLAIKYLAIQGYQFVDLSIWPELEEKSAYHFDHNYFLDRFAMELMHKTVLSTPIVENVIVGLEERKMDRMKLHALAEIPKISTPTFTYVHLYGPHYPYVLDEKGATLGLVTRMFQSWGDEILFRNQLAFVNQQLRGAVEQILEQSRRPPIIILQGDHGPPIADQTRNLRMSILNAFYMPGVKMDSVSRQISPVNNFRLLFNRYFDAHLDLLENKHFYPIGPGFIEVSKSYGKL
jgi:hypothetical protein